MPLPQPSVWGWMRGMNRRERRGEGAAAIPEKSVSEPTNITQRQRRAMKAREQRKEKIRDERGDSDAQRRSKTPKALECSDGC